MYATFDVNDASPNFHSTVKPDDFEGFLNDNVEVTELSTSPDSQANHSKEKQLQKSSHASTADPAPDNKGGQARKQRAIEKSREAQKRFRQRQKVLVSTSVPAVLDGYLAGVIDHNVLA